MKNKYNFTETLKLNYQGKFVYPKGAIQRHNEGLDETYQDTLVQAKKSKIKMPMTKAEYVKINKVEWDRKTAEHLIHKDIYPKIMKDLGYKLVYEKKATGSYGKGTIIKQIYIHKHYYKHIRFLDYSKESMITYGVEGQGFRLMPNLINQLIRMWVENDWQTMIKPQKKWKQVAQKHFARYYAWIRDNDKKRGTWEVFYYNPQRPHWMVLIYKNIYDHKTDDLQFSWIWIIHQKDVFPHPENMLKLNLAEAKAIYNYYNKTKTGGQ